MPGADALFDLFHLQHRDNLYGLAALAVFLVTTMDPETCRPAKEQIPIIITTAAAQGAILLFGSVMAEKALPGKLGKVVGHTLPYAPLAAYATYYYSRELTCKNNKDAIESGKRSKSIAYMQYIVAGVLTILVVLAGKGYDLKGMWGQYKTGKKPAAAAAAAALPINVGNPADLSMSAPFDSWADSATSAPLGGSTFSSL